LTSWKQLSPTRLHYLDFGIAYGMTDIGLVRESNEDNFLIDERLGLVVVADGMGGHMAGEVASAGAIEALHDFLATSPPEGEVDDDITIPAGLSALWQQSSPPEDGDWPGNNAAMVAAFNAINFANERLFSLNLTKGAPAGHGMGTTLTGFWQFSAGGPLAVFHVGDSRLYRYRSGRLALLTRDQTLYQEALDAGQRDNLPARNMLLQAVGPMAEVSPEIASHRIASGDLFLLCTDGLHGKVPHKAIEAVLSNTDAQNIDQSCAALITLANEHGGKDNVTVVLILCNR
jgi:serine/threonine protein phosphatase PrpC